LQLVQATAHEAISKPRDPLKADLLKAGMQYL